ncbi:MAG: hypothetical protein ACR2OO_16765 [Thermomicrobiales bacterium]
MSDFLVMVGILAVAAAVGSGAAVWLLRITADAEGPDRHPAGRADAEPFL